MRSSLRGASRAFVAAVLCLAAAVAWSPDESAAATTSARRRVQVAPAAPSGFRLGTAARPYGWSTGIADFNKDGTPDLAIADRVGRAGSSYQYQLQFSVSGLTPQVIAIESEQDAVTVRVSDIDHDDDLDVVVTGVLSRAIVGVWVNDGHGRFGRGNPGTVPPPASLAGIAGDPSAQPLATAIVKPHDVGAKPSRARAPTASADDRVASQNSVVPPGSDPISRPARAPPAALFPLIS